MELRRYIDLFLRWWWVILLGTLLAATSAYIVSKNSTPVYQASATLLVDQSKQATTDYTSLLTSERLSQTYAEWLRKRPVLDETIRRLELSTTAERLAAKIEVQLVRNTQLLVISVEDTDPARAAAIANLLPQVFREQNSALQAQRFESAKASIEEQLSQVRAEIVNSQEALDAAKATGNTTDAERALQEQRATETSLIKNLADIRLEEAKSTNNLFSIELAEAPTWPIRPRTMQNTLLAAIVGAMLALGAIFLGEYLDDVLKNPDDVESVLGLATLGAVPVIAESAPGNELAATGENALAKESYRVLRTNLQFASVDRPLHTVLVTSATPSEGKSLTAANLGVVLAQADRRVVVVDADLHRPRLHRVFKLPNNAGLTNALLNEGGALDALLQETTVPGLQVLTSGSLPPNPAELLGSARMRELLAQLTTVADIVVLDTPPTMAVSDTAILSSEVDGVLLVLDAGKTRREAALHALAGLRQVQARVVGAVINRIPTRGRGSYYYYYYYNHDGYVSGNGSGKKAATGLAGIIASLRSTKLKHSQRPRASKEAPKMTG